MGEVFQIATGKETRIIDLADMIEELASGSGSRPKKLIFKERRKGEIEKNYSDVKKAEKTLGFKPDINLIQGIRDLMGL